MISATITYQLKICEYSLDHPLWYRQLQAGQSCLDVPGIGVLKGSHSFRGLGRSVSGFGSARPRLGKWTPEIETRLICENNNELLRLKQGWYVKTTINNLFTFSTQQTLKEARKRQILYLEMWVKVVNRWRLQVEVCSGTYHPCWLSFALVSPHSDAAFPFDSWIQFCSLWCFLHFRYQIYHVIFKNIYKK